MNQSITIIIQSEIAGFVEKITDALYAEMKGVKTDMVSIVRVITISQAVEHALMEREEKRRVRIITTDPNWRNKESANKLTGTEVRVRHYSTEPKIIKMVRSLIPDAARIKPKLFSIGWFKSLRLFERKR